MSSYLHVKYSQTYFSSVLCLLLFYQYPLLHYTNFNVERNDERIIFIYLNFEFIFDFFFFLTLLLLLLLLIFFFSLIFFTHYLSLYNTITNHAITLVLPRNYNYRSTEFFILFLNNCIYFMPVKYYT